ncbi:MAG: hypothetical protein M1358_22185, partial [Chloroflexi bacterium]|nr:hypothetical protein [Chloroflexota bacterium]
ARVGDKMRDRAQRVRLFNLLLGQLGLKLQDWEGSNYLLLDKKGNQAIAPDLAGLWLSAEKMLGRPIDPLDPSYLESLRRAIRN